MTDRDRLVDAGFAAVLAARIELGRVVRDPSPRIDDYIRGPSGLGWPTADASFKAVEPYTRDGMFQWCGGFVAHCWGAAGLSADVRRERLASCYRLTLWHGATGSRRIDLDELRAGDILVVGAPRSPRGSHICLVERVEGDIVHTIEGNATGRLGDGTVGEGVVERTRPLRAMPGATCPISGLPHGRVCARRAYRPHLADLAE